MSVTSNATVGGSLTVSGDASMADVSTSGYATFNGDVAVAGANNLTVGTGATTLGGSLTVVGDTSMAEISTSGDATFNGDVVISGTKTLTVGTGATTMSGLLNANAGIAVDTDKFTVADGTGNTVIAGTMVTDGDVSLNSRLDVQGDSSFNQGLTVGGDLNVIGNVKLTRISEEYVSNIEVTNYKFIVAEDLSVNDNLFVSSDTSLNSNLYVKNTSILDGDVSMNSNMFLNGDASLNGGLYIAGTTNMLGDLSLNSGISIESDSSFNGRLYVADKVNVNGISVGRALNDVESTTIIGKSAGSVLTDVGGVHNTALGFEALKSNTAEPTNTAIGSQSLTLHTGGSTGQNTAVGYNSLAQTTNGGSNTAIGYQAGYENKSGSRNIFIGAGAGMDDTNGALNNVVAIGYEAKANADNQTYIKNNSVYFDVANDISGTTGVLHIGMLNFTPDGQTGMIPQSAISGLDGESQTTTGDHIIEGRVFVGGGNPTGTSVFYGGATIQKTLNVTQNITGSAGLEISGDASFNSNVTMAGVNSMLSFKTFGSQEIAGAITSSTAINDANYTSYTYKSLTDISNVDFVKTSNTGQYVMMYSSDTSANVHVSTDYGLTFNAVTIEAIDNSTYEVNRRMSMSLDGRYMIIVGNKVSGGDGVIYFSNNYGTSFTTSLSTTSLTYTCVAISGNGQNVFVGTNNEKLYVSTNYGASLTSHAQTPISTAGSGSSANLNWRMISTSTTGKYVLALTDTKVFLSNDGDDNFSNSSSWVEITTPATSSGSLTISNVNSMLMTDDGNYTFLTHTGDTNVYRLAQTTAYNYSNGVSNNDWVSASNRLNYTGAVGAVHELAATTNSGLDGKYLHIIDTVNSSKVKITSDGLNATASNITVNDDDNSTQRIYKTIAVSANGAYTYAATDDGLFIKQFNDGTTVQVETGDAFVLSKDMSLNERIFINGDIVAHNRLQVDNDVSFNSSVYVDVSLGIGVHNPAVSLDVSKNDAIRIPRGTTDERPAVAGESSHAGYIRYNTTTSQFEGYGPGDSWGSLGGVIDVDQDTKILAETSAGADNDSLQFFTAGTENMVITSGGDVSMNQGLSVQTAATLNSTAEIKDTLTLSKATGTGLSVTSNATVGGSLTVSGDASMSDISTSGYAVVAGATTLGGTLAVTDATTMSGVLNANAGIAVDTNKFTVADTTGDTVIAGTLDVSGAMMLDGALDVNSTADIQNTLTLSKATGTGLSVTSNAIVGGSLTVSGDASMADVSTSGYAAFNGDVSVADTKTFTVGTGATSLGGTLAVTDATTMSGLLNANAGIAVDTDKFTVADTTGDTAIAGTLDVSGAMMLDGALDVNSTADIQNTLTLSKETGTGLSVTSNATVGGSLTVSGDASMADVSTSGYATFNGAVAVAGSNTLTVGTGATTLGGSLAVSGDASMADVSTSGYATFNGAVAVAGSNNLTVGTGTTTMGGLLNANAGIAVDTDKFTVAANGNTAVAGTMDISGAMMLDGALDVNSTADILDTLTLSKETGTGLSVTSNATVGGSLTVSGDASMADVSTSGYATFNGAVAVAGSNTLTVGTGATTLGGALSVAGDASMADVSTSGYATFNGAVEVAGANNLTVGTGATTLGGTLAVTDATTMSGLLNANAGIAVDTDKFTVADGTGNTVIAGTMVTAGDVSLNSRLDVGGDVSLNENLTVIGELNVLGAVNLTQYNNEYITNIETTNYDLIVTEDLSLNGSMYVNGDVSLNNKLYVEDSVTFAGDASLSEISTSGDATFNGDVIVAGTKTLTVGTGTTTLGGALSVAGDASMTDMSTSGYATFNGAVEVAGANNLTVGTGATTLGGTLAVTDAATLSGLLNADAGIAVDTDKFTVATNGNTLIAGTLDVEQHS